MSAGRLATPLFVFGTLLDEDVLAIVCGRRVGLPRLEPASVEGFARRRVVDEHYPVLIEARDARVDGAVLRDLDAETFARIEFFEGEEFALAPVEARLLHSGVAITARYFAGREAFTEERWELADWQREAKAGVLARARAYMAHYGRLSKSEANELW